VPPSTVTPPVIRLVPVELRVSVPVPIFTSERVVLWPGGTSRPEKVLDVSLAPTRRVWSLEPRGIHTAPVPVRPAMVSVRPPPLSLRLPFTVTVAVSGITSLSNRRRYAPPLTVTLPWKSFAELNSVTPGVLTPPTVKPPGPVIWP